MASWRELADAEPDLAASIASIVAAHRHKTLATVRSSGAPRVSGIECAIEDGELRLGMMSDSVKLADVRRDPRVALHALSDDPPEDVREWPGDAKLSGRLVEESPDGDGARFRLDIEEAVLTRVGDPTDHLLIDSWRPDRGRQRRERR